MNYEEARQLGATSDAPGKWNWSNRNDDHIYTAYPCAYPDFDWSSIGPLDIGKVQPTGRERCDHDTREAAEFHHWDATILDIDWRPIDQTTARTLERCDFPDCQNWSTATAYSRGWMRGTYCDDHATVERYRNAHPFAPGTSEVHS